jgi:Beta-galactosidase
MKRRPLPILLALALLAVLLTAVSSGSAKPPVATPKGFFGIGPQTAITTEDARYMRVGGLETVRVAISWAGIQPTRRGGYDWAGTDATVETLTRAGLQVLPFIYSPPRWVVRDWRTMPVNNAQQRSAWRALLRAMVQRYGPGGEFWHEHSPSGVHYETAISDPLPIRNWQIWNEANFFYFAKPVSPALYAKLVTISSSAIKSVDPNARVILSGLFGEPAVGGTKGMDATDFLAALYEKPGLKHRFDGIALHPYAADSRDLENMVEGLYEVTKENRDRPPLHVTEMGWGSQSNYQEVAFERGIRGQARELKASYGYLLENQRRLNLKSIYWFSWKDLADSCNFCDSVGFFREGERYKPKPAWHAFVGITGGRARP